MATYERNGETCNGKKILVDGRWVFNPTAEQLAEAGWTLVAPPTPTAEEIAAQEREARIWELKDLLAQGDYKIIKCAEAQMMGEELPYDITALVAERNEYRAEINELEDTNE